MSEEKKEKKEKSVVEKIVEVVKPKTVTTEDLYKEQLKAIEQIKVMAEKQAANKFEVATQFEIVHACNKLTNQINVLARKSK